MLSTSPEEYLDRRKANELANYVVETVINESQSDKGIFE